MAQLTQSEKDELEQLVDTFGMDRVLDALSDICNEKAEHLRTNWQDNPAAKSWEKVARKIDGAAAFSAMTIAICVSMRNTGDLTYAAQAANTLANIWQNVRLDLLVTRPLRETMRDR